MQKELECDLEKIKKWALHKKIQFNLGPSK